MVDGNGPKYLALYDLESIEALKTESYLAIKPKTAWSKKIDEHILKLIRNVYVETPSILPIKLNTQNTKP